MAEANGSRTHEPSLRELTGELDGIKEVLSEKIVGLEKIINERDRRYEDRFTAMDEKTGLALTSSEKAVTKAETATEKRFDAVNEFRGSLKDQADRMLPRSEADAKFAALEEKIDEIKKEINSLRETRSAVISQEKTQEKHSELTHWSIGTMVAVAGVLLASLLSAAALIVAVVRPLK
jgi:hypothetical protein